MDTPIAADIESLKDSRPDIRNPAFERIVKRKSNAIPALLELLAGKNENARELAAAALASIADISSADIISKYTDDENDKVRAWSAIALRRMNDPRALHSLLKNIDDYADELHNDQTIVTYALIEWGEDILLPLIDLLNAPKQETRKHAFSVLEKIIYNKLKTKKGWEETWVLNGSYNPGSEEKFRTESIGKWKKWINGNIL